MRRGPVLRLCRLHLYRTLKPMWKFALVTAGVVLIPRLAAGAFNPDMTVAMVAMLLLYVPASLALNMTQEKIDGSLRFLAALPVTGREHAASRALALATLAMPLVIWLGAALPLFALQTVPEAVAAGLGFGAAVVLVSLVAMALQYRFSSRKARSVFTLSIVAFVAVVWTVTHFEVSARTILTPAVLVPGAAVGVAGVVAVAWYALRTIVHWAPVYERDEEGLGGGRG